jgi:hypothetical protein
MKTTSTQVRVTSLLLALLTTAVVLGGTVVGMQASAESQPVLLALEKATLKPSALQ